MAYALINHATASGPNGATTGAVDTSGASLLIARVTVASGAGAVSDSKSNTWTTLTTYGSVVPAETIYYVANPIVGSGHTATVAGVGSFSVIDFSSWSGAKTTSPFDQENGLSGAGFDGTNCRPGSITPSEDNELIICGVAYQETTNRTIDSSLTILDQTPLAGGNNYGGAVAYIIQTTAGSVNPLWNVATPGAVSIASFKAAAAGATTWGPLLGLANNRLVVAQ